jgi:hypothetical protein
VLAFTELKDELLAAQVEAHSAKAQLEVEVVLHQLGFDHQKFTYRYAGRDFRLTDVSGHVVRGILA